MESLFHVCETSEEQELINTVRGLTIIVLMLITDA